MRVSLERVEGNGSQHKALPHSNSPSSTPVSIGSNLLHNWSGTLFKFFRVGEVEEIDVFVQLHCGVLPLLVRQVAWQQGSHLSKEHRRGVRRGGGAMRGRGEEEGEEGEEPEGQLC